MVTRLYSRVVITNWSDAALRLKRAETSGEWTPGGWTPDQFPVVAPGGAQAWWQGEGDTAAGAVPFNGVETHVYYDVVVGERVIGELAIHTNNPLVESQYGVTYHVYAPAGYYASYVDVEGQSHGGRAILEISFRKTRRIAVAGFSPSKNGLQFSNAKGKDAANNPVYNSWSADLPVMTVGFIINRLLDRLPDDVASALGLGPVDDALPLTHADAGMCGGMVYTVMDYFNARQLPPLPARDANGYAIPPDSRNDLLFQHIRERLWDSFDFMGRGARWLSYSSPLYPNGDEGVPQALGVMAGRSWVSWREEWPRIRSLLERGHLAPVGLVLTDDFDIGKNHQVLAYAFEQSGQRVKLWIYDPNVPKQAPSPAIADDVSLEFDISSTSDAVWVRWNNGRPADAMKRVFAILWMDNYQPKVAPFGRPYEPRAVRVANLTASELKVVTVDGEVERETTGHCGNPMRFGKWITQTSITFVAQLSGFANGTIRWTVGGQVVPAGAPSVTVNNGSGVQTTIGCAWHGGSALALTSEPGVEVNVPVSVDVDDWQQDPKRGEAVFTAAGSFEGLKVEDLQAETRCIASTIPVPYDLGKFVPQVPPEHPDWNPEVWKETMLAELRRDESINPLVQTAITDFVRLQAEVPEFRKVAGSLANRRLFR